MNEKFIIQNRDKTTVTKNENKDGYINPFEFTDREMEIVLERMIQKNPDFQMQSKPVKLSGGLLNYVWRIRGETGSIFPSLIAKWAPPFIASNPQIQLDPGRIIIEANALKTFGKSGSLSHLTNEKIRLPEFVWMDTTHNILIMEDVCNCPDLAEWIQLSQENEKVYSIGKSIGTFIANIHKYSANQSDLGLQFLNQRIQKTRLEVLYQNVKMYAQKAHLENVDDVGNAALAYGKLLQAPGNVIIMGDLWLPSIIVSGEELRIIDWELSHYGRPSQDVGHLAAHLWMHTHRPPSKFTADNARLILQGFLESYRTTLGKDFDQIFGVDGVQESSIHFGSEILARTVGYFQTGYLYQGLDWNHPDIQQAAQTAARHILNPAGEKTFEILK
jgi:5-methylthioribose kinase